MQLISCHAGCGEREVAALFDKYNLATLPVVDDEGKLTGVITSDDVISLLRAKLSSKNRRRGSPMASLSAEPTTFPLRSCAASWSAW